MHAPAFTPDYAISPGATRRETLIAQGVMQSAAACALGLSAYRFRALISGRRELTADTASRLEALTGIPATFWNRAQSNYVAHRNRINRQLFLRRPRTLAERQRHILARQAQSPRHGICATTPKAACQTSWIQLKNPLPIRFHL